MEILNYFLERPWSILTVLAAAAVWLAIDLILRTIRAQKSMEKMNRMFDKLDAEHQEMEEKVKDISRLNIDKEIGQLQDKLKEALKKLPEEPPEKK